MLKSVNDEIPKADYLSLFIFFIFLLCCAKFLIQLANKVFFHVSAKRAVSFMLHCMVYFIVLSCIVSYYIVLYCILQKQKSPKNKYCAECLFCQRPAGNTQSHGKLRSIHSKQKQLYESGIQNPALVWAVLKHIGTSKNTNAALKSLTSA